MEFVNAKVRLLNDLGGEKDNQDILNWITRLEKLADAPIFKMEITPQVLADLKTLFPNASVDGRFDNVDEAKKYISGLKESFESKLKEVTLNSQMPWMSSRKAYVLGKDGSSSERTKELDDIRNKSAIKEVVYRGQDAYDVLDAKKASEVIKNLRDEERARDENDKYKRGFGYTGSENDGLYHFSPIPAYSADYGGRISNDEYRTPPTRGLIEGVIDSKKLLDLSELTASKSIYQSKNNTDYWNLYSKYMGTSPAVFGYEWSPSRPTFQRGYSSDKDWATNIVKVLANQYEKVNGKRMPANIGLPSALKKNIDPNGSYQPLVDEMAERVSKTDGSTYQLFKTPIFKSFLKESGFDAIKYKDDGSSPGKPEGTPAYATTKPTQFKSYFGKEKVNPKSADMFDES